MNLTLISDTLRSALCQQIAEEKTNAQIYLYLCGILRNKGLDNLAKQFLEQHGEETGHALEIFDLLTDLNAQVDILDIQEVATPIETIIDIAALFCDREVITTKSLNEIKKLALQEDNPVVEEKMRAMLVKQQKEYAEAASFMDNAVLCGSDWWRVKVWNDAVGG